MVAVGLFAKPPFPGRVKTRLIPDIGADKAARVYRYCLEYTLDVTRRSGLGYRLYLSDACDDILFQHEDYCLQTGDNLGTRMFNALRELLDGNNDGAIVIGSDCLDLVTTHLQQAAQALADNDLVFLPAIDGGYALIGCRIINPELFNDVSWSSSQVLKQTTTNAENLGYRVTLLETVRDIDTLQDLGHYPELLKLLE